MICCLMILIITLPITNVVSVKTSCLQSSSPLANYTQEGNITLGFIAPINTYSFRTAISFKDRPSPSPCKLFRRDQYKSILSLIFAIEEINQNQELLPNITLGFHMFDSCFSEDYSLRGTLQAMTGDGRNIPNFKCAPPTRVTGIVGDPLSTSSVVMARVLGLWRTPQVSFAASYPSLSNKQDYPSFLRTIVSTEGQPYALVELCKALGWNWIGILISSTDYAIQGGVIFKREASMNGICIAFYETVDFDLITIKLSAIIDNVRKSTAAAVILFCSPAEVNYILFEVIKQKVSGKIWIGVEAWFTSPVFFQTDFWKLLNGTIGISRSRRILPYFPHFLQEFYPSKYPRMLNISQFWERSFSCSWVTINSTVNTSQNSTQPCTGMERLITDDITEYNDPASQYVYMAHNAVYALAYALHNLLSCRPGEGPFAGRSCADKRDFRYWQLLYYLKNVQFVNTAGELVLFDVSGDSYGYFDIMNWRIEGNRLGHYVKVGSFNNYITNGSKLSINESVIVWAGGQTKTPSSVCSVSCLPGQRKVLQTGQPVCCFDCVQCPEGMISSQINSIDCTACLDHEWPNNKQNQCLPKVIEFLSYQEPLGLVLASSSSTFGLITVLVLSVFVKFKETVIVKANNRSLSYLLLLSLMSCFLSSLFFIGRPGRLTCIIRQSIFGVTFTLCISCILAKTIIVVMAFKATKPDSRLRMWVGSQTAIVIVTLCTFVQVIVITIWLAIFPPFMEPNAHAIIGTVLLECNEGSSVMFYSVLGYLGFLALLSFIVAFLARTLPDNFNEAKYITFSMLIFLSVWVSFIPAYLSTKGKYIVAVEIFAIIFSSLGLLCCIFCPKCFIILFRPSLNTREFLAASRAKST